MVNGAVQTRRVDPSHDPFRPTRLAARNRGDGRFDDVTAAGGPAFTAIQVSRGAAFGDLDNDGRTDVAAGINNGPPRVVERRGQLHHRTAATHAFTDAIWWRSRRDSSQGHLHWRQVRADAATRRRAIHAIVDSALRRS